MELGIRPDRATAPVTAPATPARDAAAPAAAGKPRPPDGNTLPAMTLRQAIEQIQDFLDDSQRQLQFQVDENSGRTVVRVVDPGSGEVIRQFPSEELLQIAATLERSGLRLFDGQG
jgi:flagellar protein FlaG